MSARRVRFGQLPERPLPSVCLLCPSCLGTFSASRGDYFQAPSENICRCGDCNEPLRLVRRKVTYVSISPEEAQ